MSGTLHVTALGRGPDLALVHGWGGHGGLLRPLAAALAEQHRVHLVDLPGHGSSRGMAFRDGLPGLAHQLAAAVPVARAWLGWSLGGLGCLQLAIDRPDRVDALVTVATTPRFTADDGWSAALPAERLATFATALADAPAATMARFTALVAQGGNDARRVLRLLRDALDEAARPDATALRYGLGLLADGDLRDALPRLRARSLWLFGEHDALIPAAAAAAVARRLPGAKVSTLHGTGHAPFLPDPATCANAVMEFLDG